jgi:hypothetical protein
MIESDLQYRVTQEQVARLEAGLARMNLSQPSAEEIHPELQEGVKASVRYLLAKLYDEIAVYEAKHGRPASDERGNGSEPGTETRQADSRTHGADGC